MKVAFVVHQYPPRYSTGTEIYAHRMALTLRRRDHDVRVFTHEPDPKRQTTLKVVDGDVDGVPVTRLTFFEGVAPNPILHDYYSVFLGKVFGEWLDDTQPDVVHVFHLMGLGLSVVEECHARGIPVLVQLMDYWFLCPTVQLLRHDGSLCKGPEIEACIECLAPRNFNYQVLRMFGRREGWVEAPLPSDDFADLNHNIPMLLRQALRGRPAIIRRVLEKATLLVAPSRFIGSFFRQHGFQAGQMRHVPYGVDLPPGNVDPQPVNGKGTVTFGYFGSVNPQKGLEILVSAFRECRSDKLRLVVRGNMKHFPKYARRVRAFADVDPRILFTGPFAHDELTQALSSIDVLVVPSVWYENTPFVVLEAFSAGRPVIASDLGGLSELVIDGVNGRTFRAGDPGALMNVLREFEDDRELLRRLADGIGPVRTLEENGDDFLNLWEESLAAQAAETKTA